LDSIRPRGAAQAVSDAAFVETCHEL